MLGNPNVMDGERPSSATWCGASEGYSDLVQSICPIRTGDGVVVAGIQSATATQRHVLQGPITTLVIDLYPVVLDQDFMEGLEEKIATFIERIIFQLPLMLLFDLSCVQIILLIFRACAPDTVLLALEPPVEARIGTISPPFGEMFRDFEYSVLKKRGRRKWVVNLICKMTGTKFREVVRADSKRAAYLALHDRYKFVPQAFCSQGLVIDVVLLLTALYNHYVLTKRKGIGVYLALLHFLRSRYPNIPSFDLDSMGQFPLIVREAITYVLEFTMHETTHGHQPQGVTDVPFFKSMLTIASVLLAVFGLYHETNVSFSDVVKVVQGSMTRSPTLSAATTVSQFVEELRGIFLTMKAYFSSGYDYRTFFDCYQELQEFQIELGRIASEHEALPLRLECNLTVELQSLSAALQRLKDRLQRLETSHPKRKIEIIALRQKLLVLEDLVRGSMQRSMSTRVVPYSIMLVGSSAIGKTGMIDTILHQFAADNPFSRVASPLVPPLDMGSVYKSTLGNSSVDTYMTGLYSSSWGGVFDDVCVTYPQYNPAASEVVTAIIRMLNSFPYATEQAEISRKGNIYCAFQFFLATGNVPDLHARIMSPHPSAILRRFNVFIEPKVKPNFTKDGTTELDPVAVAQYLEQNPCPNGTPLPVHTYSGYKYEVTQNGPRRKDLFKDIEVDALFSWLRTDWDSHAAKEVARHNRNKEVKYCSICRSIGATVVNGVSCCIKCSEGLCAFFWNLTILDLVVFAPLIEELLKRFLFHFFLSYWAVLIFPCVEMLFYIRAGAKWRIRLPCVLLHFLFFLSADVFASGGIWLSVVVHACWNLLMVLQVHTYEEVFTALKPYILLIFVPVAVAGAADVIFNDQLIALSALTWIYSIGIMLSINSASDVLSRAFWCLSVLSAPVGTPWHMVTILSSIKGRKIFGLQMALLSTSSCLWFIAVVYATFIAGMSCFGSIAGVQMVYSHFVYSIAHVIVFLQRVREYINCFVYPFTWLRHKFRVLGATIRNRGLLQRIGLLLVLIGSGVTLYYLARIAYKPQGQSQSQEVLMGSNVWATMGDRYIGQNPGVQPEPFHTQIAGNCAYVSYGDFTVRVFGIHNRHYIATAHELEALKAHAGDGAEVRVHYSIKQFSTCRVQISASDIYIHPTKDFGVVHLPNSTLRRDLRDYFLPDTEYGKANAIPSGSIAVFTPGGFIKRTFVQLKKSNINVNYASGRRQVCAYTGISYCGDEPYHTQVGDCGAVAYVAVQGNCTIYGIHFAGSGTTSSIVPITRDDVNVAIASISSRSIITVDEEEYKIQARVAHIDLQPDLHKKCPLNFLDPGADGVFPLVVGTEGAVSQFHNRDTQFVVSPYINWWASKLSVQVAGEHGGVFPLAVVGKFLPINLPRATWIPKFRFCSVVAQTKELLSSYKLHDLGNRYFDHLMSLEAFRHRLGGVAPLTDHETVNGIFGSRFVNSMNMKSSAGFPHRGIKRDVLDHNDDGTYAMTAAMMDTVCSMERRAREGRVPGITFTATYKDEVVSATKLKPPDIDFSDQEAVRRCLEETKYGKIRVFQASNVESTFLIRKYFLGLVSALQEFGLHSGIAVGTNCFSPEWRDLYYHLCPEGWGRNFVCGDFSSFDQRMGSEWLLAAWDILIKLLTRTRWFQGLAAADQLETLRMLDAIAFDVANPLIRFFGDVFRLTGCNASGHPLTVIINCIANILYMSYAFGVIYPEEDFFSCVRFSTYGDDNVLNVSDRCLNYNQVTITEVLSGINVVYTNADKTNTTAAFVSEPSFLKRTWCFRDGVCFCPIDHETIQKMLACEPKRNELSSLGRMVQVLGSAAIEFIQYGPQTHQNFIAIAHEFIAEHGAKAEFSCLMPKGFHQYETYVLEWENGRSIARLDDQADVEFFV